MVVDKETMTRLHALAAMYVVEDRVADTENLIARKPQKIMELRRLCRLLGL